MAASLWIGEAGALSHGSAARALRFEGFSEEVIHLSTCGTGRAHTGLAIHRVGPELLRHVITVDRMQVASTRRTVFDVLASGDERGEMLLDQAIRRRSNILEQMWLMLDEPWTFRRRGIAIVRGALEVRTPGTGPSQVDLADLCTRLLRKHRLPMPEREFPIDLAERTIHADLAYPVLKIAIECDGYSAHGNARSFEDDRARDADLHALGWRVLRFTWAQLTYEPQKVIERTSAVLGA